MSGYVPSPENNPGFTNINLVSSGNSQLLSILSAEDIVPGSTPSYQLCKTIYSYHPLGAKMAETPIKVAQSQPRSIAIPHPMEERLKKAFTDAWKTIGGPTINGNQLILNLMRTSRIYGISSLVMGERGRDPAKPLALDQISDADIYFNVYDPLNTAGSLVLDQDPTSPDFQKVRAISVGGQQYHPSRTIVVMNEQPIYLQFTTAAFGFSGRSVYQRALFPMKTFLQSMITDDLVTKKVGLLIHNATAPGPVTNNRIMNFFGWKRQQLQSGMTGNVLTIGEKEVISSLNFQNLEGPAGQARDHALKNIAMAAQMPAKLLEQEEMIGGMAEGTEDAKSIAQYIDGLRQEMDPVYGFLDTIVQRKAWSPSFYRAVQQEVSEYKGVPYETAFYQWSNAFVTKWPNLLEEPESDKIKVEEIRFKSATAVVEVMVPALDPDNKAAVISWLADEVNSQRQLFSAKLNIDEAKLAAYVPPVAAPGGEKEPEAKPFGANA